MPRETSTLNHRRDLHAGKPNNLSSYRVVEISWILGIIVRTLESPFNQRPQLCPYILIEHILAQLRFHYGLRLIQIRGKPGVCHHVLASVGGGSAQQLVSETNDEGGA